MTKWDKPTCQALRVPSPHFAISPLFPINLAKASGRACQLSGFRWIASLCLPQRSSHGLCASFLGREVNGGIWYKFYGTDFNIEGSAKPRGEKRIQTICKRQSRCQRLIQDQRLRNQEQWFQRQKRSLINTVDKLINTVDRSYCYSNRIRCTRGGVRMGQLCLNMQE